MTVLSVGTNKEYTTIASAVAASHDGDVLEVQAGTYTNDFVTINTKITIEGVGGMVHLLATVAPPDGKAIFTINADASIDQLEFSGAAVADNNGAGIRYQGGILTLTNDYFHDNQDGLLGGIPATGVGTGSITIANTVFANNGAGDGYSHNLYVGDIASLNINNSYFTGAIVGHEIKSRAEYTTVTNSRIQDGPSGTASYSIDLPNGGTAVITNNVIEKGPNSQNSNFIETGAEGNVHANSSLTLTGNTILNDRAPGATLLNNVADVPAIISGNAVWNLTSSQIVGGSATVAGNTTLTSEPALDTSSPVAGPITLPVVTAPSIPQYQGVSFTPTGVGEDGYIVGATVGYDTGSGTIDYSQATTTTNGTGGFLLTGGTGNLILTGGTDTSTGLAFTGTLQAPAGSTVLSPLTTLVRAVMTTTSGSAAAANASVATALGLPSGTDLTSLDVVSGTLAGNTLAAHAFQAGAQIQDIVALVTAAGGINAGNAVFAGLAQNVVAGGNISLTDSTSVMALAVSAGLTTSAASSVATIVASTAAALSTQLSSASTASQIFSDIVGASIAQQGVAASAIASAVLSGGSIASAAANYSSGLTDTLLTADTQAIRNTLATLGTIGNSSPGPVIMQGSSNKLVFNGGVATIATALASNSADVLSVTLNSDSAFSTGSKLELSNGSLLFTPGFITSSNAGPDTLSYSVLDTATGISTTATQTVNLGLVVNNADNSSYLYVYNPAAMVSAITTKYAALNAGGAKIYDIIDNTAGTSLLYTFNPTMTVAKTIDSYSSAHGTGTNISTVVDNTDGSSVLYSNNPTQTVIKTITQYTGADAVGPRKTDIVDNTDSSSVLYSYNPTSSVTKTVTQYTGADAIGTRKTDIVDNNDGSSVLYSYNPTSTVTKTVTQYTGADAVGSRTTDIIDNVNGTSVLYAYNPSSTVSETITSYNALDATGTITQQIVDFTSGQSSVAILTNGALVTGYYSGPNGTGSPIPHASSAEVTSDASAFSTSSVSASSNSMAFISSDQLLDPGARSTAVQFVSGLTNDTLVLHPSANDTVQGFDLQANDAFDISALLTSANIDPNAAGFALSNYVDVVASGTSAIILFDSTGHGGGSAVATLINGAALATDTQLMAAFKV